MDTVLKLFRTTNFRWLKAKYFFGQSRRGMTEYKYNPDLGGVFKPSA